MGIILGSCVMSIVERFTIRMKDMFTFVMIALLSLHSDEILYFGAYKLFVVHLSGDSSQCCYSGVYEYQICV